MAWYAMITKVTGNEIKSHIFPTKHALLTSLTRHGFLHENRWRVGKTVMKIDLYDGDQLVETIDTPPPTSMT